MLVVQLQGLLKLIQRWSRRKRVKFNVEKFHVLDVDSLKILKRLKNSIRFDGMISSWLNRLKYFGIIIDHNEISMTEHLGYICKRFKKVCA